MTFFTFVRFTTLVPLHDFIFQSSSVIDNEACSIPYSYFLLISDICQCGRLTCEREEAEGRCPMRQQVTTAVLLFVFVDVTLTTSTSTTAECADRHIFSDHPSAGAVNAQEKFLE
ncbi:unnamed protein product [Strongylus vulgaris]|uniref:Uncharacterized protein n=1 Tax=Strongylus vulgaris TaxID=40348 RepID=A0A3P7J5B1_STRVU|nr:unnamed protein product [Strongylus vulgaris]